MANAAMDHLRIPTSTVGDGIEKSLFEFAVKALGYTDAAAARRVQSMRLLFNLPAEEAKKVEASLTTGELSLSNLSTLQRFLNDEKKQRRVTYGASEKLALLKEPVLPPRTRDQRSENPRCIPAKLRAAVLARACYQCEYTDPATKRRCTARHYLQIDHVTPVAHGGAATPANLRALCAAHNRLAADRVGLSGR
jgi:hypothetical protein